MSKIRIVTRLRPQIQGEVADGVVTVKRESDGTSSVTVLNRRDASQQTKFSFTSAYGQSATQEEIYNDNVKQLIDEVYRGMTVTVFAYGVTSSGKTHTIQGSKAQPGIIPRVVADLFSRTSSSPGVQVRIGVSYMELYKDDCYDLFVERDLATKLPIRTNQDGQIAVANLSEVPVTSVTEFDKLYSAATKRRSTAATNLNRASSRSHAMLTLYIRLLHQASNQMATGKINLVDLAGSESNKMTGNDSARLAESSAINKSLAVLGQVIHALNTNAPRIPYRNSKLTRLLQDALGGHSIGLLICNLAPGAKFSKETVYTLNFATRSKLIENRPVADIKELPQTRVFPFTFSTQQNAESGSTSNNSLSGPAPVAPRPSLLPNAGRSRLPRLSGIATEPFRPFALPSTNTRMSITPSEIPSGGALGQPSEAIVGMTKDELEERIAKVVEQEVARRLAELEAEQRRQSVGDGSVNGSTAQSRADSPANASASDSRDPVVPSGVLTPLMKRHQELDEELKARLAELEQKVERERREGSPSDAMSPSSKKKTGRAYVALARTQSNRGNLKLALDLYRKAETYAPDNIKLKERIIEIEWAVKHGTEFVADPRQKQRGKNKEKKRGSKRSAAMVIERKQDEDFLMDEGLEGDCTRARQGQEDGLPLSDTTNGNAVRSSQKRNIATDDSAAIESSAKKPRKEKGTRYDSDDDEEWAPTRTPKCKTRAGGRD